MKDTNPEFDRELESRVKENLSPIDVEESYIEMLDSEGSVTVCGMEFMPSRILKELDETAYDCGMSDYVDSLDVTEFDGQYYDAKAVEDLREELLTEQES